jgi:hypothetical protein
VFNVAVRDGTPLQVATLWRSTTQSEDALMRTRQVLAGICALASGFAARAEVPAEWKSCRKEVAQYCSKAADSGAIFECIEKREKLGKKSGLSADCLEAHEKYEKAHPAPGGSGY